VERGIVQVADPSAVVLRALDGTEVTVAVGPATRYRLNGRPAALAEIGSGLVAEAVLHGSGPALVIRAFGRVAGSVETGRLVRVRPRGLVLRHGPRGSVRIALNARTTVWRGGGRLAAGALRPGMRVQVVRGPTGAARVVLVLRGP
jgi:hypothetical protein